MKGIDRFGPVHRGPTSPWAEYVDLTQFHAPVVPSLHDSQLHEYRNGMARLETAAFTHELIVLSSIELVDGFLTDRPGLVRLLVCVREPCTGGHVYGVWSHCFPFGTREADSPIMLPRPYADWLEPEPDRVHYPHTCPRCAAPAYIGMRIVECSGGCPTVGGRS